MSAGDFGGFSKCTAHRIVHRVSASIAQLSGHHINFPSTENLISGTQLEFYNIARFPKVIGAMDCTHVKIKSPGGETAELYRNRKGYFSLNVQAICNAKLEFTDIVARWPGSTHDSTIFNNCYRKMQFEQGRYGDALLLADGGYPCRNYLIPPLQEPHTPCEHLYNESQIRTRNVIERMFGVWKRRFPALALGLQVKLENVFPIIVATAVLHNILRKRGEPLPPDDEDLNMPAPWDEIFELGQVRENGAGVRNETRNEHMQMRRKLIDNYFESLRTQ